MKQHVSIDVVGTGEFLATQGARVFVMLRRWPENQVKEWVRVVIIGQHREVVGGGASGAWPQ